MTKKKKIEQPKRKLTARWTLEIESDFYPKSVPKPKVPMTEEQEAEEIIKRLKQTPQERERERQEYWEQELVKTIAEEIKNEIDAEMIKKLTEIVKKK